MTAIRIHPTIIISGLIHKSTSMKQSISKPQRSYVSHCPHLSKMNLVNDILHLCSIPTLILPSHLQVGLPSGFYHKTTLTYFSTNAFHSGCHVYASISSTLHFKESSKCTASLFVQYRSLQLFNCTVTSHNLADACTKYEM